jgi:hypothetical protein
MVAAVSGDLVRTKKDTDERRATMRTRSGEKTKLEKERVREALESTPL